MTIINEPNFFCVITRFVVKHHVWSDMVSFVVKKNGHHKDTYYDGIDYVFKIY